MKKIILVLIIIFFNNENFAQLCSNPIQIDNLYGNVDVFWCGDQDDDGLPVGEGLMKHVYENGNIALLTGKFIKGTLNGEGRLVFNEIVPDELGFINEILLKINCTETMLFTQLKIMMAH